MQKLINKLTINPRLIFLIDGLGALLTAGSLLAMITVFEEYFSMPQMALITLYVVALIFSIYSTWCYIYFPQNWKSFLKAIIIGNSLYCLATAVLTFYNYPQLTCLDVTYFMLEVVVVSVLVYVETKVLSST